MEDVLDIRARPFDQDKVVICMDEKPQQMLADARPPFDPGPGRPRTLDYEYVRKGTASIFLFTQPLTGWIHVSARNRHTAVDWAEEVRDSSMCVSRT